MYLNALNGYDTYISYLPFWTIAMFQKVQPNIKINFVSFWMKNPYNVPLKYRETLLKDGREAFLKQYQEKNAYYITLNGLPPLTDEAADFIYLSPTLAKALESTTEIPVHLLPVSVQDKFLNTTEFDKAIGKNKLYLQYIGSKKIDVYTHDHRFPRKTSFPHDDRAACNRRRSNDPFGARNDLLRRTASDEFAVQKLWCKHHPDAFGRFLHSE